MSKRLVELVEKNNNMMKLLGIRNNSKKFTVFSFY